MKNFDAPTRSSVPGFTAIHDSEWLELSGWGPQVPGTYAGFAGYPPPITGLLATTFVNVTELDQSRPAAAPADDACRTRVIARMTAPTRAFTEDRDMADLPIFASFHPRPPTRDASPESLERAYRQKEAILLDRGARNDEEDNAPYWGPDRRGPLAGGRALDRPACSVCIGHLLDALVQSRLARFAVDDERREVLDEVTGVQIDRVLAASHDLRQQPVSEALTPLSLRVAGEQPIEVVAVLGVHIDAALVEAGTVQQRDHDQDAANVLRRDGPAQARGGLDPRVLGGMDARRDEHRRAGELPRDREVGPLVFPETFVVGEREMSGGALAGARDRDLAERGRLRMRHDASLSKVQ